MSIWSRIADAIASLASGEALSAVFDRLRTPPERSVGFTIAVIALGAKMAKADGHVTRDEVTAFREVFHIPAHAEAHAARVFNLARQDVAGFEEYAKRIGRLFTPEASVLTDLLEGLFHIAMADGDYHPNEDDFLHRVAEIWGIKDFTFHRLRTRFVPNTKPDPFTILGASPDMPYDDIRKIWRQLVRDTHPDAMIARGLPEEAVKLAEKRMVAINKAWEDIQKMQKT